MPLCGPAVVSRVESNDDAVRVECDIIGHFTTDQELRLLLAKSFEALDGPLPYLPPRFLDRR